MSLSSSDELLFAQAKDLSWTVFAKGLMGVIFTGVSSEGYRVAIPALGKRLHKLAFLGELKNYEALYRLDGAIFFALIMLIATWNLLPEVIHGLADFQNEGAAWRTRQHRHLGRLQAIVLLMIDLCIFYLGVVKMSWGSMFSFTAILGTVAYVSVAFYVAYVGVGLKKDIQLIKRRM